jgi:hypothetical protein
MNTGEEENVTFLTSMMGSCDPEIARRVLRKHNGDVQRAATSILEGDTGAEDSSSWLTDYGSSTDVPTTVVQPSTPPREYNDVLSVLYTSFTALVASKPEKDQAIIDLTGDDENVELRRALEASLATPAYGPSGSAQFRPSDRAPDPNWAMVPSNVCPISSSRRCRHSLISSPF